MKKLTILPERMEQLINDNVSNKKMRLFIKLTMLAFFTGLIFVFSPAYAGIGSFFGYSDNTGELFTQILTGKSARTTIAMCFGTKTMNGVTSLSFIQNIMNFTAGLGIVFILVHVILGMVEAAQRGTLTNEYLTKAIITFVLPVFLILNINSLVNAIQQGGLYAKDTILMATYDVSETEYESLGVETLEDIAAEKEIDESGIYEHVSNIMGYDDDETFWGALQNGISDAFHHAIGAAGMFVLQLFLMCVDIGVRIGIMVACYGALGRLIIYQAFLPMGISDIGKEGLRSNGMKNIKRYFAVYLEIAMFYLLNHIGWKVFDILAMQQGKVAGIIICFIAAGAGVRALMSSARTLSERLLNAR